MIKKEYYKLSSKEKHIRTDYDSEYDTIHIRIGKAEARDAPSLSSFDPRMSMNPEEAKTVIKLLNEMLEQIDGAA
jgi:hypothetical protein